MSVSACIWRGQWVDIWKAVAGIWACGGIDKNQKYHGCLQPDGPQISLSFWVVPHGKLIVLLLFLSGENAVYSYCSIKFHL